VVGGAQSSNEVIFKSVNFLLCGIVAIAEWWCGGANWNSIPALSMNN
jgi:hypothetical protein